MELPVVQFAKADDGVSLAYCVQGDGPPLIWLDVPFFSHVQYETALDETRELHARLGRSVRFVRMDYRGSGASDRGSTDFRIDRLGNDVLAVADELGVERFSLFARNASGPVAIRLAAEHPERIEKLMLYATEADPGTHPIDAQMAALSNLIDVDWEMYTKAMVKVIIGVSDEDATIAAGYMRRCVDPETWKAASAAVREFDVRGDLAQVQAPTLVMSPQYGESASEADSRRLAAAIPDAELSLVPGRAIPFGDPSATATVIEKHLGVEGGPNSRATSAAQVIFVTDIEGHTALMDELGDERGRQLLREHERVIRRALDRHGGREVKTMGDGFLATFSSAAAALECAAQLQQSMAAVNTASFGLSEPLRVRVGITAGEPVEEKGDVFGASVIAAARIAGEAIGGQVLLADVVRQLALGSRLAFVDAGVRELRGLDTPVRLWELDWSGTPAGGRTLQDQR